MINTVEDWIEHVKIAMGFKQGDTKIGTPIWTKKAYENFCNGEFSFGVTSTNVMEAILLVIKEYDPSKYDSALAAAKKTIELERKKGKKLIKLAKMYERMRGVRVLEKLTEKELELMQNFDSQIMETIADVLKNSKDLLEIEKWQNFELDFSIPVEEKIIIFQKIKSNIENFKNVVGIYAIFDGDTCLYIGQGKRIWERIKSHYQASKGLVSNKRWVGYFEQYQKNLKIFWIEYNKLNEPVLDDKLRGLFEHVLQIKYNPIFNSYKYYY